MLTRSVRKSLVDTRIPTSVLSSTCSLPIRAARHFNSTAQIVETPVDSLNISTEAPPTSKQVAASPSIISPSSRSSQRSGRQAPPPPIETVTAAPLSDSVKSLLPLLASQPEHYITAHIHAKPYLLTKGDTVRLPFKMPGVVPGDILRLNRATHIGSRDYTLTGAPYVDERLFECRATVLGSEGEPVRVKEKTKRRNRRVRTVRTKLKFTVLRVGDLKVKTLEEVEGRL